MKDKKRHELLGYLIEPVLEHYGSDSRINARSFEDIEKQFNINKRQVWEYASELIQNDEIVFYSVKFQGFMGTDTGIVSYTSKKYLNRKKNKQRESIKFYLGVFIPIVSLLIALFTVLSKFDRINTETKDSIQKLEKRLVDLEKKAGNKGYSSVGKNTPVK